MNNFFIIVMFCIGCWTSFWTILSLITPTRAARLRGSLWDKVGHLADRLGIQIKSEKEE